MQTAMSIKDVARELGVSEDTARRAVARGDLRSFKVGLGKTGARRVRRQDFESFVHSRMEPSKPGVHDVVAGGGR